MKDCLFCGIVAGSVPAAKVAETDQVLAFRDIRPMAPTHVLLIPKVHIVDSADGVGAEQAELLGEMFALASRVARNEGLTRGWRLVTNVGDDAGKSVHHLHLHLLGGRHLGWPPG